MTTSTTKDTFPELTSNAISVLNRRYLIKDPRTNAPAEPPETMFRRVALNLAQAEYEYGADEQTVEDVTSEFYGIMRRLEFMPNSPTLMNAGRDLQQLSACFVLPVDDDLHSIFTRVRDTAIIQQSGGGTGFAFSRLRPEGDKVKSTGGIASGPASFIRAFDVGTDVVKQGGTRRGANMGVLSVYHPDVMKFIALKRDGATLQNFNISIAVDQEFMEKAMARQDYTVVNPRDNENAGVLNAGEVMDAIVDNAWLTGDPGLIFIDRMNHDNPNPQLGQIESTNPCVTGDTMVYTQDGIKPIKDLHEEGNFHVIATDGRFNVGRFSWAIDVWSSGVKPVYRLATREGYQIRLTRDHKVMTQRGWVPAEQLEQGDLVHIADSGGGFGQAGDAETGLALGRLIAYCTFSGSSRQTRCPELPADKHQPGPALARTADDVATVAADPRNAQAVGRITAAEPQTETFRPDRLAAIIEGYGNTPGNKLHVPRSVFHGNREMQTGFLRALFTADGHVQDNPHEAITVRLFSNHPELLQDVQRLLLNLRVASHVHLNPSATANCQTNPGHELAISDDNLLRFAQDVGLALPTKQDRLQRAIASQRNGLRKEPFLARFDSLVYEGDEVIYDLTAPVSQSFIANGIVVSNCGEQSLLPYESCNLGSVNLARMTRRNEDGSYELDEDKLNATARTAVHMLDNVIDMNSYPLESIEQTTKSTRRIGVGVMGFADFLIQLGLRYDSEEGVAMGQEVMGKIRAAVWDASQRLAVTRGAFPEWKNSRYGNGPAMRNSAPTTIAPTGTISIIAGASSGIEPLFALAYVRNVMDNTELGEVNENFVADAKQMGFYSEELMQRIAKAGGHIPEDDPDVPQAVKNVYRTSHQISPEWHVRMQAAFQSETDNAVSKTINLPNDATVDDVRFAYELAWREGCKGITVYRDGSKECQVLTGGDYTPRLAELTPPPASNGNAPAGSMAPRNGSTPTTVAHT